MRANIETGTDTASVCFFDPAALPADFDQHAREDIMQGNRKLAELGRIWYQDTGSDGGYLFHFYVDEEVPARIQQQSLEPQSIDSFQVPSGTLWACGAEYAARDPGEAGLEKFRHMGQKFTLPAGNYAVDVWRAEWPEDAIEEEIRKRCGKGDSKWERRLGPAAGVLFVLSALGTIIAGINTLPLLWRGGWKEEVTWVWVGIGSAWLVFASLCKVLNRIANNPARRDAVLDFPSIVVHMRRIGNYSETKETP